MTAFARVYWKHLGVAALLVTLWVTFAAVDHSGWFWIVVALPIATTGLVLAGRWVLNARDVMKRNEATLKLAADLIAENSELKGSADAALAEAKRAFLEGVNEGRATVFGVLHGAAADLPQIVSIAMVGDSVGLVAEPGNRVPTVGARFSVVFKRTETMLGVVEMVGQDEKLNLVYLRCTEPTSVKWWQGLSDRVESEPHAPPGVELDRYRLPVDPTTFSQVEAEMAIQADEAAEEPEDG